MGSEMCIRDRTPWGGRLDGAKNVAGYAGARIAGPRPIFGIISFVTSVACRGTTSPLRRRGPMGYFRGASGRTHPKRLGTRGKQPGTRPRRAPRRSLLRLCHCIAWGDGFVDPGTGRPGDCRRFEIHSATGGGSFQHAGGTGALGAPGKEERGGGGEEVFGREGAHECPWGAPGGHPEAGGTIPEIKNEGPATPLPRTSSGTGPNVQSAPGRKKRKRRRSSRRRRRPWTRRRRA